MSNFEARIQRQKQAIEQEKKKKEAEEDNLKKDLLSSQIFEEMKKIINSSEIREALLVWYEKFKLKNPPVFEPKIVHGLETQGYKKPDRLFACSTVYIGEIYVSSPYDSLEEGHYDKKWIRIEITCTEGKLSYSFYNGNSNSERDSLEELLDDMARAIIFKENHPWVEVGFLTKLRSNSEKE